MAGGLFKFITELRKVCTNSKGKNVFFGSSITRITKHHIQLAIRVEELLAVHPDDDSIWNNTDPYDISLDNTSDTKGPVSIDVTEEPVKATTTPMSIEIGNNTNLASDSVTTTTTPMLIENDETWYDANKEYHLWYNTVETMDNYQEWVDPPTVLGDTDKTKPINEHIELYVCCFGLACIYVFWKALRTVRYVYLRVLDFIVSGDLLMIRRGGLSIVNDKLSNNY